MQTIDSNQFVIFLHIQKTGGITLQRMLRRKLGSSLKTRALRLMTKNNRGKLDQPATVEAQLQQKCLADRYVVGHFCYGIHRFLPQPFTYMSFLREPVSRIVSLYHYSRTNPTAYYHEHAVNKSLEEFALQTQLMELDNGQVRFLAGDEDDWFINRTPVGECDEQLLATAKENIDTHFSFIGLTEQFDQSVLLMQQLMGWDSCLYLRRNSSRVTEKKPVSDQLKRQIADRNWLDIQLYEYVRIRLNAQLEKYSLDHCSLQKFRDDNAKFNARLGPFYDTYSQLKAFAQGQGHRPS